MAFQHTKTVQNAAFMPLFLSECVREDVGILVFLAADTYEALGMS
jgi:hypothetical protein